MIHAELSFISEIWGDSSKCLVSKSWADCVWNMAGWSKQREKSFHFLSNKQATTRKEASLKSGFVAELAVFFVSRRAELAAVSYTKDTQLTLSKKAHFLKCLNISMLQCPLAAACNVQKIPTFAK